jgi:hypothetical protein
MQFGHNLAIRILCSPLGRALKSSEEGEGEGVFPAREGSFERPLGLSKRVMAHQIKNLWHTKKTMITEHHVAEKLFNELMRLPLWVKLVFYVDLRKDLAQYLSGPTLEQLTADEPIALYVPILTQTGEVFLTAGEVYPNLKALLADCQLRLSILDICLRHEWSLESVCQLLLEAFERKFILAPPSVKVHSSIEYLAGSTRLGEYLLKLGLIKSDELDQALRAQKYIDEAMSDHTHLANILINLGYVTRRDCETILLLKEESQRPIQHTPFLRVFTT